MPATTTPQNVNMLHQWIRNSMIQAQQEAKAAKYRKRTDKKKANKAA